MSQELPDWFIQKARNITAKRPRAVIEHILAHGYITTEELKTLYGYDHPPRAARDVREQGIPLETFRVPDSSGKRIAAYRFADPSKIRTGSLSGRKAFSKAFKELLVARTSARCGVCLAAYETRYLQIDHRVPYEVGGERGGEQSPEEFQLVCGSCNRAKSWSCEHCANWIEKKQVSVCQTCYWASPEEHKHVALVAIRRLDIVWMGAETRDHDRLVKMARRAGKPLADFVRDVLRKHSP